jgi:membrane protein DedA with SNARE-associated domain
VLASVSGSITTFVGDHGVYAVFVLMAIDAVFPAASELVMVYAGALASGAFASQHVVLFGHQIDSGGWAFVTMALAGTLGTRARLLGWRIARRAGGRSSSVTGARSTWPERLERQSWFDRHDRWAVLLGRITPVVRSFVSIPAGVFRMAFWPYLWPTVIGSAIWAFALAGVGYAFGSNYERFHHAFDLVLLAGAGVLVLYLVFRWFSRLRSRA